MHFFPVKYCLDIIQKLYLYPLATVFDFLLYLKIMEWTLLFGIIFITVKRITPLGSTVIVNSVFNHQHEDNDRLYSKLYRETKACCQGLHIVFSIFAQPYTLPSHHPLQQGIYHNNTITKTRALLKTDTYRCTILFSPVILYN